MCRLCAIRFLSLIDLVGHHHSANFLSRPRLKTADGAVVQLRADIKLFKLDVPVPPSGRDASGNAAHGRVPTAAAVSTVPVSSGFAPSSSIGRDEHTGDPVARPSVHVFTGARSAEIARIAALTDAQLRFAIEPSPSCSDSQGKGRRGDMT